MKKFIIYFFLLTSVALGLWPYQRPLFPLHEKLLYKSVCDTPIFYKIGTVDPRSKLPEAEFTRITQTAATIWNNTTGIKVLSYDPNAVLTVNLVFDQRQSLNDQINALEGELGNEKSSLSSEIAEYEKLASAFKERLSTFNNQVTFWNNQGGAPKEEYEKLKIEQKELQAQADKLNELARKLNQSTDSYNVGVGELNKTIKTFKQALEMKPEEGVYNPKEQRIDIYFNIERNELLHTLLHEFGHALGMGHLESEKSIMYPFTTLVITPSTEDIAAITKICEEKHILTIAKNNFLFLYQVLTEHNNK